MEHKFQWGLKWSCEDWEASSHWIQNRKNEEQKASCWGTNGVVLKANREKQDNPISILHSLPWKEMLRLERLEQIWLVGNWDLRQGRRQKEAPGFSKWGHPDTGQRHPKGRWGMWNSHPEAKQLRGFWKDRRGHEQTLGLKKPWNR